MRLATQLTLSITLALSLVTPSYAGEKPPSKKHDAPPALESAWQVEGLPVPESVLEIKNKKQHYFLVSLIDGDPLTKDGEGGIAKISPAGEILDREWVTGLNAPKGMAAYKNRLYVADIDEVVVIDMNSPDTVVRIPVPNAVFLNDVAVDRRGTMYVSDTGNGQVIRIKKDVPEVFLDEVPSANGLYAVPKGLLVGAGPELRHYDHKGQSTILSGGLPHGIDGVAPVGRSGYLVSVWEGQIYWIDRKGESTILLDSIDAGINTADFAYSKRKNLLVVPNFFSNTVTAYKLK